MVVALKYTQTSNIFQHTFPSTYAPLVQVLTTDRVLATSGVGIDDLTCRSCENILDEALELPCKHLLCCSCCFQLLKSHLDSISCPQCQQHHPFESSSFQSPPPLVDKLLKQLVLKCNREKCLKAVYLCDLKTHLDSKCTLKSTMVNQSITVDQILEQPTHTPPTQIEMETAGHVVRKMLSQSHVFSLPIIGGKSVSFVCLFVFVHTRRSNTPIKFTRL